MTTSTPTNPGWRIQLAIHRAVRRDATRLAIALDEDQGITQRRCRPTGE